MSEWVVGVDLGGTKIEVGLVSPQNQIIDRRRIQTRAVEGPESVVERIAQCVNDLSALLPDGEKVAALGICSPGPVDHETGLLIDPPNLIGLHNAPIQQMLAKRLKIPVRLEHDAKATALGEYYYGAGMGAQSLVYIIVGTGVGGAIIDRGLVVRGNHNSAGEVGHVALDRNGELCSCGSRGCVETFLSGPWLARRYEKALVERHSAPPFPERELITGEMVASLAAQGDRLAVQVMTEAGKALGVAVATMAMLFDIDLFVVGGSVAKSGDLLLEPARRELVNHTYRSVGSGVKLITSEIGDDGPILGCAWLARQAVRETVTTAETSGHSLPVFPRQAAQEPEISDLEKVSGIIFDIQRFSVHDGPGIRTNVFLKGCSLRCSWCANPESQRPHPELVFSEQRCIRCGQFIEPCGDEWMGGDTLASREKYGERVNVCPTCGIRWVGIRQTAGEIMVEVLKDLSFYKNGGGLTLTGGEPTFQPRLSEAILRLAKTHDIDTAVETTGHTHWKVFERILPFLDHILFDIKHLDGDIHRRFTGIDNILILANVRRLAATHAPVEIRVPLIPGFNADEGSLSAIADFVMEVEGLKKEISLLPYHTLGRSKYQSLGRIYPWEGHHPLSNAEVHELADVIRRRGPSVVVGG